MTALTQPEAPDLADIVARYDVGEVTRLHGVDAAGGARYLCDTEYDGKPRAWLLSRIAAADDVPPLWLAVADACDAAGLPVATPLAAADGARTETFDGGRWTLAHRLPGRHVANPTFRQCEALGRFMARMHLAAPTDADLPAIVCDPQWLQTTTAASAIGFPRWSGIRKRRIAWSRM